MDQSNQTATKHYAEIENFADNLLAEKNLTNIDEPTLRQMRDDLVERLEQVINRVVVENIPEEKLPEFEALIDRNANSAEVQEFVDHNVKDMGQKLGEAFFDFRRLYLGL